MAFFDMPIEQLRDYRPARNEPDDFEAFWTSTLAAVRGHDLNPRFERQETGLSLVDVWDVTFRGYGGQDIKGWYLRPANNTEKLPCIVEYIGYGGGRGFPHEWLFWVNAGYATLIMDTRGQGSAWRRGDTPDIPDGANPSIPGFMTQGILSRETYYYRRVFADAVRAVEVAHSRADVDSSRVAVTGASQGGGLAIAAAGLCGDNVALCMPDVPFLCHFERAVGLTDSNPYAEIVRYLHTHRDRESQVFRTLSYFDGIHFAARMIARAYFSTALMDDICPPSTVFAAYNQVQTAKDIRVYRFNQHEGGQMDHKLTQLALVNKLWRG